MSTWPTYEERTGPDGSPSQETRAFHSQDARLRAKALDPAFAIVSRPNKGPNIWERKGRKYTEEEALALCDRLEQEVAGRG